MDVLFEGDIDNEASKSVVIANLPVGEYTVEELSALRYECKTDVIQTKNVEADRTTEFAFRNEKAFGGNYSHTDVVVNKVTFNKDENGNITSAIINNQKKDAEGKTVYEKESTSDAVKE